MTTTTPAKGHSDTMTQGVRVRVGAEFLPEHSDPELGRFAYVYRVIVTNEGDRWVKLVARHWIIRDADNNVHEVRGDGLVGQTPELEPGDRFEYMSGCPLSTEWGTMEGSYEVQREDGSSFRAEVGRFFLARTAAPTSALDLA